jgi:hypothetical protein
MSTMLSAYTARVRRAGAAASRPNWSSEIVKAIASILVFGALIGASQPAAAQFNQPFVQQGGKLVGTGAIGYAYQGQSVALSEDGNTAIVGGMQDNSSIGAAWVFTQSGGVWTQQAKLVAVNPNGPIGVAQQGWSVALSADGNTAIVGGPNDNEGIGAAWIWTRSGSGSSAVWTQQAKLVGTGNVGAPREGTSVALSADGNTAIVGGPYDNGGTLNGIGAAWVWTLSNNVWTPYPSKLVGSGYVAPSYQGTSVALSGNGNTAIVGGYADNLNAGAAWVWILSSGVWSQPQTKLVASNAVGKAWQGTSVALSEDGLTAIVGGPNDNSGIGAAWVWTLNVGVWTQFQFPSKLTANDNVGAANLGASVALSQNGASENGNVAIVGGPYDNYTANTSGVGAAWVWINGDGHFSQQPKLVGSGYSSGYVLQGGSVALSGDGNTAIVGGSFNNSGIGAAWVFAVPLTVTSISPTSGPAAGGTSVYITGIGYNGATAVMFGSTAAASFSVKTGANTILATSPPGSGTVDVTVSTSEATSARSAADQFTYLPGPNTHDFNGDGKSDIAWRDTSGDNAMWLMNGSSILSSAGLGTISTAWSIVGQRDFNGDGMADWLWRDTSGDLAIWFMNGTTVTSGVGLGTVNPVWSIVGTGDFNGDGMGDILWRDTSGDIAIWLMNGSAILSSAGLGSLSTTWSVVETGDFNGDGKSDILWHDTSGDAAIWFMNGTTVSSGVGLGTIATSWSIQGAGAD